MNKLITLFILSSSFLLLGKKSSLTKPINKQSQDSIQNYPSLKIVPLENPTIDDLIQLSAKDIENNKPSAADPKNTNSSTISTKPSQWILESSIDNAPKLLKNIFFYLQSRQQSIHKSQKYITIPSFHRFILVGAPGTGKTTLARSLAYMLNCSMVFVPATAFLGNFRNQTAKNIEKFLIEETADNSPKVIIIDELHKLFEHHTIDQSDDSQSAAAFWLLLDHIEKNKPNVIIVCTANNVDKLPPEIKSRFSGKIITVPLLDKNQMIQTFKNNIIHDESIVLDDSVTHKFIIQMLNQLQNNSLRDLQLLIDSAKIFSYGEKSRNMPELPIILTRKHFQQAIDQLQTEAKALEGNFSDKLCQKLQPWGVVFGIAMNIFVLLKISIELLSHEAIKNYITKKIELIRVLS